ncbi:MAG: signal peptide peptidase SppA [Thermoguttaceae bacterium]
MNPNVNQPDIYETSGTAGGAVPPNMPPFSGASHVPPGSPQPGNVVYYPVAVPNKSRSFLGTLFMFFVGIVALGFVSLLLLGMMLSGFVAVVQNASSVLEDSKLPEKFVAGNQNAVPKIAIITISGTIVGSDDGFIAKQIENARTDKDVKAVVLRVVSPGGTITGSDYYLYKLKEMKAERGIPVIVSMGALAASGGYYVSMVGDEIYAEETTITGSIGVIVPFYNISGLCEKVGVKADPIVSGPLKEMGNFTRPMTEEERKIWQKLIDQSFDRFKEVIREGRKNFAANPEKLDEIATGQVYSAEEALENGLIDEIGFQDDAIKRAITLAGYTENNCKVVKYKTIKGLMEIMLEGKAQDAAVQAKLLKTLTSPQLYYMMPNAFPDSEE